MGALTDLEIELLNAVARGDDDSRRVLADYWAERGDEPRGALVHVQCGGLPGADALVDKHGDRWRCEAIAAGFALEYLGFQRGFAPSLVVDPDEPFARSADGFRLSPRHYQVSRIIHLSDFMVIAEARAVTATGTWGRFALKYPARWDDVALGLLERERIILERLGGRSGVCRLIETAVVRHDSGCGPALVLAWAGVSLGTLLGRPPRHGGLGEAFAISVGSQLCDAMAAMRDANVQHGDLGPGHVLVDESGVVTVVDFQSALCETDDPRLQSLPNRLNCVQT